MLITALKVHTYWLVVAGWHELDGWPKFCCKSDALRALLVDNDENAQPNRIQQLPDSQDAKSERIWQLHLTLRAERDELRDTLSSSTSPNLAWQLEHGSQTSGITSLAELDILTFRQNWHLPYSRHRALVYAACCCFPLAVPSSLADAPELVRQPWLLS